MRTATPGILVLIGLVGGLLLVVGFEAGQGRPGGAEGRGERVLSPPSVGVRHARTHDAALALAATLGVRDGITTTHAPSDSEDHDEQARSILRRARIVGSLRGLEALAGARVEIVSGTDAGLRLDVAPDGTFASPLLAAGRIVVRVDAGGSRFERVLSLLHGRTTRLDLDLGRRPTLRGRITDTDGRPVGGAEIDVDGQLAFSDPGGHFAATCSADGRVLVRVSGEGKAPVELEAVDPARELELRLEPAGRLELLVENWDTNLSIEWSRPGHRAPRGTRPTVDRSRVPLRGPTVNVDDLPAGWIQLRLLDGETLRASKAVRILPGRSTAVRLRV